MTRKVFGRRKDGRFYVKNRPSSKKVRRAVKAVKAVAKKNYVFKIRTIEDPGGEEFRVSAYSVDQAYRFLSKRLDHDEKDLRRLTVQVSTSRSPEKEQARKTIGVDRLSEDETAEVVGKQMDEVYAEIKKKFGAKVEREVENQMYEKSGFQDDVLTRVEEQMKANKGRLTADDVRFLVDYMVEQSEREDV